MTILNTAEYTYLKDQLKRLPNELEQHIINAEWSEHCSYKSSKIHIRTLPNESNILVKEQGFDAGVIDVGKGYVITVHIESHNHPSAVDPYGGAATGVGGVLRDILSNGTRPIAVLNAIRFGEIHNKEKPSSLKNQWLLKNVVKGIADYGNCMGIPTVGGEVEFDSSLEDYCLVDVASIGHGKRIDLIKNKIKKDDLIVIAGNSTGKDGIHGASFASSNLEEENRSAIQIPDPFLEKILLEATLEAIDNKCIKAMKDLGGGGLACCLSETADNLKKGFEIELSRVPLKFKDLSDTEIMISESQERMLYITDRRNFKKFSKIFDSHEIKYSIIGKVNNSKKILIKRNGHKVAEMPASLIAHAPLLNRPSEKPFYIEQLTKSFRDPQIPKELQDIIYSMISNPNICSKRWIYEQFDYDVGIRTILKPGFSDSSVLKLDNKKFVSFTLDGNSKHCYLDPYHGTMGILSESLRNTICVGAEPIGIVDHLQFGNPENKETFWTFLECIRAIRDFCKFTKIPVVGGKVSLYNETKKGPIKPTPVIGAIGIIGNKKRIQRSKCQPRDSIIIIGITADEMGGSEYFEYYCNITGGKIPIVDPEDQSKKFDSVKDIVKRKWISSIHDCSKGGFIISLMEISIQNSLGFTINIENIPTTCNRADYILLSESHNRFIITTKNPSKVKELLENKNIPFGDLGILTSEQNCIIKSKDKIIANMPLHEIIEKYRNSFSKYLKINEEKEIKFN
ncbi:MAG: phosphoribosylformylglycinamidine synthase subunit PurL [Candidatus Nitrosocosmicus sp.]